jgi:hypothetical protein
VEGHDASLSRASDSLAAPSCRDELAPPPADSDQKNSPSRFRFRPPFRPTFGFRLRPPGWASTYSRSVLGASGNLETSTPPRKTCRNVSSAICKNFSFQHLPHPDPHSVDNSWEVRRPARSVAGPYRGLSSGEGAASALVVLQLDITRVIVRSSSRTAWLREN